MDFIIKRITDITKPANTLTFKGCWANWIADEINDDFTVLIYGKAKSGKSTVAMRLAEYLAEKFGKTLYISAEEGFGFTMYKRIRNMNIQTKQLDIVEYSPELLDAITRERTTIFDEYKFLVFDSWQAMKLNDEAYLKFRALYPEKGVLVISQLNNKDKTGLAKTQHEVDVVMMVNNGKANIKGRYMEDRKGVNIIGLHRIKDPLASQPELPSETRKQ